MNLINRLNGVSLKSITFTTIPIIVLVIAASWLIVHLLSPAPPNKIVILSGPKGSNFYDDANQYAKMIRKHGVNVEVVVTTGSEQNLELLLNKKSKADVGFIKNSSTIKESAKNIVSLGTVLVNPLLVFYKGDDLNFITELKGKRVAIGPDDSATKEFVAEVLRENELNVQDITTLALESEESINALINGDVNAIFLTGELVSQDRVHQIMNIPGVKVMNFEQADGYTREFKFLSKLEIPEGAFNLGKNIPHKNIKLIGTSVELVAKESLHPALSDLIIAASKEVSGSSNMFRDKHEFPQLIEHNIPISEEANRYYKSGAPFLYKKLPFWLASFLDRMLLIFLPLLIVLIPASKIIGPLYKWRIRSRIYKWYGDLMKIQQDIKGQLSELERVNLTARLNDIEEKVNKLALPLSYASELYALRAHIEYVKARCNGKTDSVK